MLNNGTPFSELMRPRQLEDLTLPAKIIERLQAMINGDAIQNMLFYGRPGVGKTSAARVIMAHYEHASIERSGPKLRTADDVEREITGFTRTVALLSDKRKFCFIDEADAMPNSVQAVLRKVVEDTSSNCRFIMAVNECSKLQQPLRSRFLGVCFDVPPSDRKEIIARLLLRYEQVLTEHRVAFDQARLKEIVHIYWPDLREVANKIEFEFGYYRQAS